MGISNYEQGFPQGVTIKGAPIQQLYPGKVFFVNNSSVLAPGGIGGSNVNNGTYLKPFKDINAAITKTTAGRGDILAIMPGHAEAISASATFTFSKAGVAVVGLGSGDSRPTLTFDTIVDSTINVDSANCALKNFILTANFADIVMAFNVAAKSFIAEDIYIKASTATENFLSVATLLGSDNTADDLTFKNIVWIEPDTATLSMVMVETDVDRLIIEDSYINIGLNTGDLAAVVQCTAGDDARDIIIRNNDVYRLNNATTQPLLFHTATSTANSGAIYNNRCFINVNSPVLVTSNAKMSCHNNLVVSTNNSSKSGYLIPSADS